ncbi:MAG: sensor histidine kinase, partial [Bacteroidota bacterium]
NGVETKSGEFSGRGYGTYYLKLKLPDSLAQISLYVPSVGLAYKAFINDYLVGQVGVPGKTKAETVQKIKPTTYHIPDQYKGKEVFLIFHIANFSHQNGGMWYPPVIGNGDYFHDSQMKSSILNLLVLGSVLIIMLYHFFIYVLRLKEKYSLYFALACLCMFSYIITQADIALVYLFPRLSWAILLKLTYSSMIIIGSLNLKFIQTLYPSLIQRRLSQIILYISSFFALLTWLIPTSISYYFILPFQALLIFIGFYILRALILATRNGLNGGKLLLTGFSFTFLTVIHDILNSQFVIDSVTTVQYGVFIYVLTLSLVLAKKFVRFINANERLQFKLEGLNQDLEERVKVRTSELESQKELVKKQNTKLERANEELNELMAVLAHDLKSPLININSLSEMMKDRLGDSLKEESKMMQKIAGDGVKMIESLISLKKLENEDIQASMTKFNLSNTLNIKLAEFGPQASIKKLTLNSEIETEIELMNSERHMSQILDNLISNAIKFSHPNSEIYLKATQSSEAIEICIKDQGPGFTERDKSKVFGKFQKLSARPTAGESSSGLGLSIVKTLVEKMDGNIV